MEQKYYNIYNTNIYILNDFIGDIDIAEVIEELKEIVPNKFIEGVESIIFSEYPATGRSIEGTTIYIKNNFHCEELLIEEVILSIGDFIYNNLLEDKREDISKYFLFKRVKLFDEYSKRYNNKASLSEFISAEEEKEYIKNLNNIDFEDMIFLTQKYFGNYESSLSLKNYISNSFHLYVTESLNKKYDKKITKLFDNLKEETI
ncbi:MAG TPA: hypothetical protein DEG69_21825 [Flavobacteriaceae bacterium]|nr:hypothetical protein [Flavobacteriaceae bacterium]